MAHLWHTGQYPLSKEQVAAPARCIAHSALRAPDHPQEGPLPLHNREKMIDIALERLKLMQDYSMDCTCEYDDSGCWYRLSDEQKQRLVCGEIVDTVVKEMYGLVRVA